MRSVKNAECGRCGVKKMEDKQNLKKTHIITHKTVDRLVHEHLTSLSFSNKAGGREGGTLYITNFLGLKKKCMGAACLLFTKQLMLS